MLFKIFLLITLITLVLIPNTYASDKSLEIYIKSDNIKIIQQESRIYFTNNVVITREDVVILSNVMMADYGVNKNNIKSIRLRDGVRISNQEFTASGNRGFFDVKNEIFILSNNVVFDNGSSVASGEKFTYNFRTKKSSLINSKEVNKGKVTIILQDK
jgi:lipopolysaccharide transport protein LptA